MKNLGKKKNLTVTPGELATGSIEELTSNPLAEAVAPVVQPVVQEVPEPGKEVHYVFDATCPRCRANDTRLISQDGDRQVRKCIRPVCAIKFEIKGKLL